MRRFHPSAVAVLLSLAVGCTDEVSGPRQVATDADLKRAVVAMGFRPEDVKDDGSRFIVEGDILIDKRDLRDRLALAANADRTGIGAGNRVEPKAQWLAGGGGVSNARVIDLSAIANRPDWVQATRSAIQEWNAINEASVNWTEGSGAGAVQVASGSCGSDPSVIACGTFPVSGNVGTTITISSAYDYFTPSQKLLVMAHEMGHNLGLRHSNWQALNELQSGARLLSPTPATDASSVMNGGTGGQSWNGFSSNDRLAAAILFHRYFSATYSATGPTVSWAAQPGAYGYHVWYYRFVPGYDADGNPTTIEDDVDLGMVYDTSVTIPDADTGETACQNEVWIDAFFSTSPAHSTASAAVATCVYW